MLSAGTDWQGLTTRMGDPAFFITEEFDPLLRHMRETAPVHWTQAWPEEGFWSVTRYADVKSVYEQPELFSSEARGNTIPTGPAVPNLDRDAAGYGGIVAYTDPPRHGALRRVFARSFAGPTIARMQGACQAIVDDLVDAALERGECDFVNDVVAPLPVHFVCHLLGVPQEDWDLVTRYANSFANYTEPEFQLGDTPAETVRIAQAAIFDYAAKLVEDRRRKPSDDLVMTAVNAQADGEPLSEREIIWWVWAILAGGFETSRNVMTGGLHALVENPEMESRLRGNPGLIHSAVDEMVRWTTPASANYRVATADCSLNDTAIRKGDGIVTWTISANRDHRVFDDPYRFDIGRRPNPHLSFGHGIHNCIGRMAALMEVRLMVETVLARTQAIELLAPPVRTASTFTVGLKSMAVRLLPK